MSDQRVLGMLNSRDREQMRRGNELLEIVHNALQGVAMELSAYQHVTLHERSVLKSRCFRHVEKAVADAYFKGKEE